MVLCHTRFLCVGSGMPGAAHICHHTDIIYLGYDAELSNARLQLTLVH